MHSHLPVGRLAGYLESRSRETTWLKIVAATGAVAALDVVLPSVGFSPLYLPIICGAAWGLGAREGYFVAVIAAFLAVLSGLKEDSSASSEIVALRVLIRIGAFVFLAATITSFRRSYDREQYHAHRDRMTGTLNKEVFQTRCAAAIQNAAHTGHTLLLVVLDLDDFKTVNSREGHQAGDEVLRAFSKGLSAVMRREDLIGRIGGDEFALLVRVPSIAEGQKIARDIHKRLTENLTSSPHYVTCSMGAILIPSDTPRDDSELMHLADKAMYHAKQIGKNAVAIVQAGNQLVRDRNSGQHQADARYDERCD